MLPFIVHIFKAFNKSVALDQEAAIDFHVPNFIPIKTLDIINHVGERSSLLGHHFHVWIYLYSKMHSIIPKPF